MREYAHKPLRVTAMCVTAPYKAIQNAFPRSHLFKLPSGRTGHIHLMDAVGNTKAYPGDWILRHENGGYVEILTEDEFNKRYEEIQ